MSKTTKDNSCQHNDNSCPSGNVIIHEDDGGVWYEDTDTGRCWEYCAVCDRLYCFIYTVADRNFLRFG